MLTPAQLEAMPYELQQLVDQLEDDILESMAQRLAQADFDKEAFAWEMQKAQELTKTREDIVKILSRKTGVMERTIEEILKFAAVESLSFDAAIYSMAGLNPLPIVRSPGMQQLLRAGIENTQGVMRNWTRTTANTATKQFEDAMDRAYMQVLSGAFSPGTAVSRAVSKLAKGGIQAVRYPSGHVDHMDVAARRAVRTGVAQTTGKLQEQLAGELGCDLMQITSHLGARPSHAVWQGRIVSRSGKSGYLTLDDIEYGSGQGFKGWNCRHDWYPYIEGLSFSTAELYDPNENREVYEATQKQRALERKVRAAKRACVADRAALDSCKDVETKVKLTEQLERDGAQLKERRKALREFVESYRSPYGGKLVRYSYREKAEGFDRAMARKMREISGQTLIADSKSGIIKTDKQFGKKIGKHAADYGLNPSKAEDRAKMESIIDDIHDNFDEKRIGPWKGQDGDVLFYAKGKDVVVAKRSGEFITILRGGVENGRFKNARKF